MAKITANNSITVAAGSTITFCEGGIGQAILDGNIYTLGMSDVFLGPFASTETIQVLVTSGTIYYYTTAATGAAANMTPVFVDPLTGVTTPNASAVAIPEPYLPGPGRLRDYLPKTAAMFKRVRAGGRGLVLINGDSTVNGFGSTLATANSSRRNLPAVMARSLRQFGIHAHFNGFCGDQAVGTANVTTNNPNLVLGSGVTTDFAGSIGSNFFKINGAGALSWTGTEPFDTVYVDYLTTNAAGGDLVVDIGGGTLATLASLQASGVYSSGPIALGSTAIHTVNVKRAGGATIQGNVFAIRCYNSANPGVLLMTVGGGGKKTADLIQGGNYGYVNTYAMMAPDLVICGEQINDWDNDVTVATHAANITTMITQSKNAGNSDVILLDGPRSRSSIATLAVQDAYHASDIATATGQGAPMVSLWDVFGPNDNTTDQNVTYLDATGHLTEVGYGDYGYILACMIGREFAA